MLSLAGAQGYDGGVKPACLCFWMLVEIPFIVSTRSTLIPRQFRQYPSQPSISYRVTLICFLDIFGVPRLPSFGCLFGRYASGDGTKLRAQQVCRRGLSRIGGSAGNLPPGAGEDEASRGGEGGIQGHRRLRVSNVPVRKTVDPLSRFFFFFVSPNRG